MGWFFSKEQMEEDNYTTGKDLVLIPGDPEGGTAANPEG